MIDFDSFKIKVSDQALMVATGKTLLVVYPFADSKNAAGKLLTSLGVDLAKLFAKIWPDHRDFPSGESVWLKMPAGARFPRVIVYFAGTSGTPHDVVVDVLASMVEEGLKDEEVSIVWDFLPVGRQFGPTETLGLDPEGIYAALMHESLYVGLVSFQDNWEHPVTIVVLAGEDAQVATTLYERVRDGYKASLIYAGNCG